MAKSLSRFLPPTPFPAVTCSLVLLLASLGAPPAGAAEPDEGPKILRFEVLPTVDEGVQWHELHWQVTGTDRVRLFADGNEMPGRSQQADGSLGWPLSMSGGMRMQLKATTTFVLVAESQSGDSVRARRVAEVEPRNRPPKSPGESMGQDPELPTIRVFRAEPTRVEPGSEIHFAWEVENAHLIRIFEGDHEIDLRGLESTLSTGGAAVLSTTIDETTTFRLEAISRSRRAASKSLTIRVDATAEPEGPCSVEGRLAGDWRQEVREHPTGPKTLWTVAVYLFAADADRPSGHASIDDRGHYRIEGLEAGASYRLRPDWESTPRQATVSCGAGEALRGPTFRITGGPVLD